MSDENIGPDKNSVPFYPDQVRRELWVIAGLVALLLVIGAVGMIYPVSLGDPADPLNTPAHVKPEWYYLALYQLLKFVPKTAGALLPIIAILILTFWPFLDRRPDASSRAWRLRAAVVAAGLGLMILLTVWGEMS